MANFSTIITQHTQLLDEDNEENEPVSTSKDWISIPISRLFNFTNYSWSSRYTRFEALIFEGELDLYDLLEMDAEDDDASPNAIYSSRIRCIVIFLYGIVVSCNVRV